MAAGRNDFRAFVEHGGLVSSRYHCLLTEANVTAASAALVGSCFPYEPPFNGVIQILRF